MCLACAVRIEAGTILERGLAIRDFEEKIATLQNALGNKQDARIRRATMSKRTEVTKSLAELTERKSQELADFWKGSGRYAPGRAQDLPYDWWKDDEMDPILALKSPPHLCDDEDEARDRPARSFHDR